METNISSNTEVLETGKIPLGSLAENRVQAIKSIVLLLLNEISLLETIQIRKDSLFSEHAISLADEVTNFEIELIRLALVRAEGCQRAAARLLGTKTTTLCAKMKRYGIKLQGITLQSVNNSGRQRNALAPKLIG